MTKFKIQGVGLDTSTITSFGGIEDDGYGYIYTSIPANNDFLVGSYIKSLKRTPPIFVYVDFLESLDVVLESHLDTLGRSKAQLLLLSANIKWEGLSEKIKELPVEHFGIQGPESKEQLETIHNAFKGCQVALEYIAMPLCPLEFNLEIINYCQENKISIIGLNPMGGYLSAPRNIKAFSVPYLLGFSATYSDIICLSGRDLFKAWEDKLYLESLIGEEINPGYILKKSTFKPVKEIRKAVFTSINLGEDRVIPYDDPEILLKKEDFTYRIGKPLQNLKEKVVWEEELEDDVTNFLRIVHYPEDGSKEVAFAVARYKALEYLELLFPESQGWSIDMMKVGHNVLLMSARKAPEIKGVFIWQKVIVTEPRQFLLILPPEGEVTFIEVKNADEKE